MELSEVKIGDMVTFTHNKKKLTGKVIYRHDSADNKKAERAALMGHVNVQVMDNNSYPVTVHVSKLKPAIKEETQMEEHLNETVLDLIDHIDSGDNIAAEATLNNILQQRAAEVLDALKVEVASTMFNTQECSDCVEEEKKMKKKMEDEEEDDEEEIDEALKGNQHKIDANKNGKIDAHDFKLLRGKKKGMKEEAELEEGKWNYPTDMTKTKTTSQTGSTNAADNRARRKAFRKKAKAAAHKKLMSGMKEAVELDEASYSAKKARAGKDIGKPGKMFGKIAKKASQKYGKERGAKIAGAVLAKLRKKGK